MNKIITDYACLLLKMICCMEEGAVKKMTPTGGVKYARYTVGRGTHLCRVPFSD